MVEQRDSLRVSQTVTLRCLPVSIVKDAKWLLLETSTEQKQRQIISASYLNYLSECVDICTEVSM